MINKVLRFFFKITPFLSQYYSGVATILMLHRVDYIDKNKIYANENMKISPNFLERFIIEAKQYGYEFISLDRLQKLLSGNENTHKKLVITLDDGYIDNFTQAYPIFNKHQIPFTVYITTSFPEQNAILWWYILEDLLHSHSHIELSDGSYYSYSNMVEKNKVFLQIRKKILNLDQTDLLTNLNQLFGKYRVDWKGKTKELAMSWEQIKLLSQSSLTTIGGHTKNHYAFNKISHELIQQEINDANLLIHQHTGRFVEHFAFPFGSIHEVEQKQIEWIKAFDFKTVVTTRKGNILKQHKDYLYCLPRVMLTENFEIRTLSLIKRKPFVTI